jgi:signal peptidase I
MGDERGMGGSDRREQAGSPARGEDAVSERITGPQPAPGQPEVPPPGAGRPQDDGAQGHRAQGHRAQEHRAHRNRAHRNRGGAMGFARELVIVVGTALVLSLVIKTFLVQAFYIPSPSMEATLAAGDRVLVSQLTPGPLDLHRGDVVVFKDPGQWLDPVPEAQRGRVSQAVVDVMTFVGVLPQDSGEHLIKRVVGMPGDTVACCDGQGRLTVNGRPLDEPYVYPGDVPSEMTFQVVVPQDRLWVMGDHRSASQDSRWHQNLAGQGTVPVDLVVGRAVVVIWPLPRAGWLGDFPETFAAVPAP